MKPDTRSFYARSVQAAIEHIAMHLDDALELEALARVACLSPFHFHRVFRGMVGETPLELTRRLRLERAAWRLRDKERAVTEIAFDAGYETHEAFTRAFRSSYSTSPSGFRLRKYPRIEIAASVWRPLQRRRCGTAIHRSRLRRTHHGSRYQGHAQASCRDRQTRRPVQPDSESVRAPGRRGRARRDCCRRQAR